jgi:hypothetical protein
VTYSYVVDVPMPIELYAAAHGAIQEAAGDTDYGMLVHIARATDTGFQITEVWQSKEHCDRFDVEVAIPVITRISGGQPMPQPPREEFATLGLIVGSARVNF